MALIPELLSPSRGRGQTNQQTGPQPLSLSTSVNGNPNYNVELDASGWMDASNSAWQNVQGLPGGNSGSGRVAGGGFERAKATTQEVQDDQLMRHQLDQMLAWDSPLMDRARQQGIDRASARGLGNSSIAAGNAMGALIDRATPIAQFDAGRFGSVADQNMAAQNQASLTNSQISGNLSAAKMQANAQLQAQRQAAQDQMRQMMLGHQLGGLDDFRRHALGVETREDDQSYRAGQSDIDRMIQQAQFGAQHGLARDQFQHGAGLDWANFGQRDRQLNAQIYNAQFAPYFGAISSIYSNPNLEADQMNSAVDNLSQMYPGFTNQAWQAIPPGLINQQAMQSAMYLPQMPPINVGGGG